MLDTYFSCIDIPQVKLVPGSRSGGEFGYDADWDDDWDIDRSLLGDDDEGDDTSGFGAFGAEGNMVEFREEGEVNIAALGVVPESDDEVTEVTKSWVQAGEDPLPCVYVCVCIFNCI